MSDGQPSPAQAQGSTPNQAPTQTPPQQQSNPCDEPKTPPPVEQKPPCGEPKPPEPEKPKDPCAEKPKDPCAPEDPCKKPPVGEWDPRCPEQPADPCAKPQSGDTPAGCELSTAATLKDQLKNLEQQLLKEQGEIEAMEQKRASIADLPDRIQAIQKAIDALNATDPPYRDFYQATAVQRKTILGFIEMLKCDEKLKLGKDEEQCLTAAIDAGRARVDDAKKAYRDYLPKLRQHELAYARAEWRLKDARLVHDFFKTSLQDAIKKRRDDLAKLKGLAEAKKDKCETWLWVREMEELLKSGRTEKDPTLPCYPPKDVVEGTFSSGLTVGTFLDCWTPESYRSQCEKAVLRLNQAEYEEKCRKTGLEAARKRLTELEKAVRDTMDKRRDWVLKQLKLEKCCPGNGNGKGA